MGKIAVFGCGKEGHRLFYRMREDGVHVDYFVDNKRTEDFWGHKITRLDEIDDLKDTFFYISSDRYYKEIREQLESKGLTEFDHFVKGGAYNKKTVMINGNCYVKAISLCLNSNAEFSKKYYIYDAVPVCEKDMKQTEPLMKNCDVCIGQDIRVNNPFGEQCSDQYITQRLKPDCKKIVMPNLVGMGKMLYVQWDSCFNDKNTDVAIKYGEFPFSDRNIDKKYKEGCSIDEIVSLIESGHSFSEEEIDDIFVASVEKYREREKNWDIKVVDYILDSFKDHQMFYDPYHPTNALYEYISKEILKLLDIKSDEVFMNIKHNPSELFIYPEVAKRLGLRYWKADDCVRRDVADSIFPTPMSVRKWVESYIAWNYERNQYNY